jgi:ACS family D-galactonate transporter-like MFS transporter
MNAYSHNHTAAAQAASAVPRSRRRIGILTLLAIGTMINYLDRTVLGIAAPSLTAELGIDAAVMGIVFPPSPGPTRWRKFPAACSSTVSATK